MLTYLGIFIGVIMSKALCRMSVNEDETGVDPALGSSRGEKAGSELSYNNVKYDECYIF
jgi:hypothetical protein